MLYNDHQNIEEKEYPSEITPCPIDKYSPDNPEKNIQQSPIFFFFINNIFMDKWEHHQRKSRQVIWVSKSRKNTIHIESSLIKWSQGIESNSLKNSVENNSAKADKAKYRETFFLSRRKTLEDEKKCKKCCVKKPTVVLLRITRNKIQIYILIQPERNNCPNKKNTQSHEKSMRKLR